MERRGRAAEQPLEAPCCPAARRPRPALLTLLLASATAPCARSQGSTDVEVLLAEHPGCFLKGFQWTPDIRNSNTKALSLEECQLQCRNMPNCKVFAYFAFTSDCYFGDWRARMVESPYGAIAGYGVCPEPKAAPSDLCRTEVPNDGFPGLNGNSSHQAWPSGRQPWSLECWPKNWTGGYIPCQKVEVLQDSRDKWPGKCMGLTRQAESLQNTEDPASKRLCERSCHENPLCATWQKGAYGDCWQGVGSNCFLREGFASQGSQRLQHGEVRKLMDLSGWQIVGLYKTFDNAQNFFLKDEDAVSACKLACYSDIRCQFWQYSPKYGCFVEDPSRGSSPAYPLTLDWAYRSTAFALNCIAGEYIQHYCPDHLTTAYPTQAPMGMTSCMRRGARYDPPDMLFQMRSVEMNAAACQTRCKEASGCSHFAYWPDGGCHLQDEHAKEVVAEDFRVISGPPSCDVSKGIALNASATTYGDGLTPEGLKALNGGTLPTPSAPATATQPPQPVFQDPVVAGQVAEVKVSINNLDSSSLTDAERQQLEAQYLGTLSQGLGVPPGGFRAAPLGQGGHVKLVPEPPVGSKVVAYVPQIKPTAGNTDVAQMQANLRSLSFASELERATISVLGSSHGAIRDGNLEVVNPLVQLVRVQATTTAPPQEVECGFLCEYWPLMLGCALIAALGGVAGFCLFRQKPTKKASRGTRSLLSDTEQNSTYTPSDYSGYSDGEDGDPSIWAAEPSWEETTPSRGSPSPARDMSLGDMYSKTKGDTIFEA